MSEADKLFEELGYEIVLNDSILIECVKKYKNNIKRPRHIIFSVLDKNVCICEENERGFAVERDWFSM